MTKHRKARKLGKTQNSSLGLGDLWWPSVVSSYVVGHFRWQPLPKITKMTTMALKTQIQNKTQTKKLKLKTQSQNLNSKFKILTQTQKFKLKTKKNLKSKLKLKSLYLER